jgi:hypothetical protein
LPTLIHKILQSSSYVSDTAFVSRCTALGQYIPTVLQSTRTPQTMPLSRNGLIFHSLGDNVR